MSSRVWRWYLVLGLLGTAGYAAVPAGLFKDSFYYELFASAAVVGILVGVWRNSPEHRLPWVLFAGSQALFLAGDITFTVYERVLGISPFPSVADGMYLAGYPLLALGLLLVVRRRMPSYDWASLLDAAIVTIALGVLSWAFLMAPYFEDPSLSLGGVLISVAYPLADILLLAVAVRLLFSAGTRSTPLLLIGLSLVALLASDTVYAAFNVSSGYESGGFVDLGWMLAYVLFGTAALHPHMARIGDHASEVQRRFPFWRLALLTGALAAGSIGLLVQDLRGMSIDVFVFSVVGLGLSVLVFTRLGGVIRRHERSIARERVLREAGSALVEASGREAIWWAGTRAALSLMDDGWGARAVLAVGPAERLSVVAAAGEDVEELAGRTLPALPEATRAALASCGLVEAPPAVRAEIGADGSGEVVLSPLFVRDELHGILGLYCDHSPSRELRDGFQALASQIALALESAALTEDLLFRKSEERFRSLVQNSLDVIMVLDPDTTIRYLTPSIELALGHDPNDLVGQKLDAILHPEDLPRTLTFLAEASSSLERQPTREFRLRRRDGSYRCVEIVAGNLLHEPSIGGIVLTARDVTERKGLEQQLRRRAFQDSLTGLPNRELFVDRLQHALARRRRFPVGVLYVDLDDFKSVNDSLGHSTGDAVLVETAARLCSAVRAGDTVARLGGDEFVILLDEIAEPRDATMLAGRILRQLATPFVVDGREIVCTVSVGIAITQDGEREADGIVHAADLAMYEAKCGGKGRFSVYKPGMRRAVMKWLELKSELRRAIERQQLVVHYQPIMALQQGTMVGVEALVRWNHPERGLVPPSEFISAAEETGMIEPLGRWVLEEACRQTRAWQGRHPSDTPLWVSVNISPRQLAGSGPVDGVSRALAVSGLDPASLVVELTESVIAGDVDQLVAQLEALKALGVRIAIDDFGTGYSALAHLRRLPLDIVKIDKQLVGDLVDGTEQADLVGTIVRLGRMLDLDVIAEGIEQREQVERLTELRCALGQGFHYSRPLTSDGIEVLLARDDHVDAAVA